MFGKNEQVLFNLILILPIVARMSRKPHFMETENPMEDFTEENLVSDNQPFSTLLQSTSTSSTTTANTTNYTTASNSTSPIANTTSTGSTSSISGDTNTASFLSTSSWHTDPFNTSSTTPSFSKVSVVLNKRLFLTYANIVPNCTL